jgi:hypothetical protein
VRHVEHHRVLAASPVLVEHAVYWTAFSRRRVVNSSRAECTVLRIERAVAHADGI